MFKNIIQNLFSFPFVFLFVALQSHASAQVTQSTAPVSNPHFTKHTYKTDDGDTIDYWLMTPVKIEVGRKYPLLLSLHGRGGTTAAASMLAKENNRKKYPCFIMAPRVDSSVGYWGRPKGLELPDRKPMLTSALKAMDAIMKRLPIDTKRIYVTGQSMGGAGTFCAILSRPEAFAAAIPIAAGWAPEDAPKMKHIPLWIFIGDADKKVRVDYARKITQAIKYAGGAPKYTEYPGIPHNSWTKAYADPATFEWLFKQKNR